MSLPTRFAEAAEKVSSGALGNLSQNVLLDLYGLYAVVQKGPAPSEGPSAFLDPRGFAKWTAWTSESHLTKEDAMVKYIELVAERDAKPASNRGEGQGSSEAFGNKSSTGFDLSGEGEWEETGQNWDICYWATVGDMKSVKHCLEKQNVSPNHRDQDGLTPLMRAVDRNEQQIVDLLVAAGAEINAVDEEGQTALHYAAYCEHADMAGLLVTYGASPDIKDKDDMTPLEAANGETAESIQKAKAGTWKRTTERYDSVVKGGEMWGGGSMWSGTGLVVMGVSFVVVAGLIIRHRYRR